MFPRSADLQEIIGCALAGLGPPARSVRVDLPPGLAGVMAEPPVGKGSSRTLTADALRYSPTGSPPLLTASVSGARVELRVADRDRDRMFVPFARLGGTDPTTLTSLSSMQVALPLVRR